MPTPDDKSQAARAAALLELVLTSPGIEAYLDELATTVAGLSQAIVGAGVTVRRSGHTLTVATSNELTAAVDEVQYGMGTGPCLESFETDELVAVPDLAQETRWGAYPAHAMEHGVRSSLSVPVRVGGSPVGVLNIYGAEAGLFTGDLRQRFVDFAGQIQVSVAVALRSAEQGDLVDQMHTAMQTRSLIDQALGILMARQRCTAPEAFTVLRSASQSRNRKIVDIAADLITATTGQEPEKGRFEMSEGRTPSGVNGARRA